MSFLGKLNRSSLAYYWTVLALVSLTVSGIFAFLIAIARTPVIAGLFTNGDFFRRALVVHVDLGVSIWFTAFPVALFHLLNKARSPEQLSKISLSVSIAGMILITLTGFSRYGEPYLSNYVPVISHPLFIFGLLLYFGGVAFNYFSVGLLGGGSAKVDSAFGVSQMGIRVAALYFLASLATFVLSALFIPQNLPGPNHYEMLMWGGGHVLQFSNVAFMLVCWILILTSWLGDVPLTRKRAFFIFAWLGLPLFLVPYLASQDIASKAHREGFTMLMRWGLFGPVIFFLLSVMPAVFRGSKSRSWKDVRPLTVILSAILILTGFGFGAFVQGPDLRLPGHYHASIGAVTLTFMGGIYVVLHGLGKLSAGDFKVTSARVQAILYGVGQFIFSLGMFVAGVYGASRKTYGVEQHLRHPGQTVGMWIMGVGGMFALVGGLVFITAVMSRLWKRKKAL